MRFTKFTVTLPDELAQQVEKLGRERGIEPAEIIEEAVVARAGSADDVAAYFRKRATRAKPGAAVRFFQRKGGEPPRDGDAAK